MDKLGLLFKTVEYRDLPENLKPAVFLAIKQERRKRILTNLILHGTASLLSLGAMIWAFFYAMSSFAQAGFAEYFSLLASERLSAMTYWKEIGLTMAESLPVFSLVILLLTLVFSFWFVGRTTQETKNIILLPA